MAEKENTEFTNKRFVVKFDDASHLPVHYVNAVNVQTGTAEFFFTLGAAIPPMIQSISDLENLDSLNAYPLIRFAMSPETLQQLLNLMGQQLEQFVRLQAVRLRQSREEEITDEH